MSGKMFAMRPERPQIHFTHWTPHIARFIASMDPQELWKYTYGLLKEDQPPKDGDWIVNPDMVVATPYFGCESSASRDGLDPIGEPTYDPVMKMGSGRRFYRTIADPVDSVPGMAWFLACNDHSELEQFVHGPMYEACKLAVAKGRIIPVHCLITTKDRSDGPLQACLASILGQIRVPDMIRIANDGGANESIAQFVPAFAERDCKMMIVDGEGKWQHHNHSELDYYCHLGINFRIDDDEIAEPNVIMRLEKHLLETDYTAVGPAVTIPGRRYAHDPFPSTVKNCLYAPPAQWFVTGNDDLIPVGHLHSCFAYRAGTDAQYQTNLNTPFREETIFSSQFNCAADLGVTVRHFPASHGGQRSLTKDMCEEADVYMAKEHGCEKAKIINAKFGVGDSIILRDLLPEIVAKFGAVAVAVSRPDVFDDMDIDGLEIFPGAPGESLLSMNGIDPKKDSFYCWASEQPDGQNITDLMRKYYLEDHTLA